MSRCLKNCLKTNVAILVLMRLLRQTEDMTPAAVSTTGIRIGYARVSTGHQSLDQQLDALVAAGVNPERVYSDKLSGTSTREQRPGLAALLDFAREGDAI